MKYDVVDMEGKKMKSIELPNQFNENYEPNLIKRAVLAIFSKIRQSYGAEYGAGRVHSAKLSRRRRDYKGAYGKGISRVPRKTTWNRGEQFGWVGANAPGTVGGRKAHPPKGEKSWTQKINKKERRKAIRSALSGLALEKKMIIIEDKFENLKKTKDFKAVLEKLGFGSELKRVADKNIRAGKGSNRGRKYKIKQGPIVVLSRECPAYNSVHNLQGFSVAGVNELNAMLLTKGHLSIRPAIWSEAAINKLKESNLFRR